MDKIRLIEDIKKGLSEGLISQEEILKACCESRKPARADALTWDISKTLYFIGAAVIVIGVGIFAGQKWTILNDVSKILLTLGFALACYAMGVLFSHYKKIELVGQSFYFASMLVMPLGLHVVFNRAGFDVATYQMQTLISGILLTYYLLSFAVYKKHIFTVFNVAYGTWFFFALSSYLVKINPCFSGQTFNNYRILFVGLSYIFLGYYFSAKDKIAYSRLLYSAGAIAFLSAAYALGGYMPRQNIFWEVAYPGIIFGLIFLGIYLKTRVFLTFCSIYLFTYICKITVAYFKDSIGWPLSLIVIGFFFIAIGYLAVHLNRRLSSAT